MIPAVRRLSTRQLRMSTDYWYAFARFLLIPPSFSSSGKLQQSIQASVFVLFITIELLLTTQGKYEKVPYQSLCFPDNSKNASPYKRSVYMVMRPYVVSCLSTSQNSFVHYITVFYSLSRLISLCLKQIIS